MLRWDAMASPGTEHEDESKRSAVDASARDDDSAAKPPEPETKEPAPVEAGLPVTAPPVAGPLAPPPVADAAPAPEATVPSPTEPASAAASMAKTAALPAPPSAALVSSSPAIEISSGPSRLATLLGARPSSAWLAAFGITAVLAFVVGVFTGRGLRSEPEQRATQTAVPSKTAPPSPVVAPVAAATPGVSAEPSIVRPRMPATTTKSTGFNAQAAKLAIDRVVPRLKACKQAGEPPGSATVSVTFAPTGRVSSAQVTNTRYAGTRTGTCIAQRLREARVPEFTGAPVTVKRSVAVR